MRPNAGTVTLLLEEAKADPAAKEQLFLRVREELYRTARGYMRKQPRDHTLQATQLVHMAFGELTAKKQLEWRDRRHFFRLASRVMWNDLVDHARRRRPKKVEASVMAAQPDRNGREPGLRLEREETLLAVHEAVTELEQTDPELAEVFRLRCLIDWRVGLSGTTAAAVHERGPLDRLRTFQEVGRILDMPHSTAKRKYDAACQLMRRRLGDLM